MFQSRRDGQLDLYVLDLRRNAPPRRLTFDPDQDYLPAWSPNGRDIVFTSWRRLDGSPLRAPYLYVVDAEGGVEHRLPLESLNTSAGASWSPDGQYLVYSRQPAGTKGADLFMARHDGRDERRLTNDSARDIYNGSPAFSPDGAWIAFYSDEGLGSAQLQLISSDGAERRTVRKLGKNWYPRWSDDGSWLLITSPAGPDADGLDMDLFALPMDGLKEPIRLLGGSARDSEGSWRPRP